MSLLRLLVQNKNIREFNFNDDKLYKIGKVRMKVFTGSLILIILTTVAVIYFNSFADSTSIEMPKIDEINVEKDVESSDQIADVSQEDLIRNIHKVVLPKNLNSFIYNGSIIQYGEGYLLAYRYDIYRTPTKENLQHNVTSPQSKHFPYFQQYICLVQLNKNFQVVDKKPYFCSELGNRSYDPRLVYIADELFLIYTCARSEDIDSLRSSWMCTSKVHSDGKGFKCDPPLPLQLEPHTQFEKNWVPFDYNRTLHLGYTINPHVVLSSSPEGNCSIIHKTSPSISKDFGIIRGGTPAILVDGEYLAFFHSVLNGVYSMAAYTFEASPPFHLTRISPQVITHPDFYSTPKSNPISSYNVVFPAGIVADGDRIIVSYGENDVAVKVVEFDKKLLIKSLQPIARTDEIL